MVVEGGRGRKTLCTPFVPLSRHVLVFSRALITAPITRFSVLCHARSVLYLKI